VDRGTHRGPKFRHMKQARLRRRPETAQIVRESGGPTVFFFALWLGNIWKYRATAGTVAKSASPTRHYIDRS
jgi:hypothetical protein